MLYLKLVNDFVYQFPYPLEQLKSDNPGTSFPSILSESVLAEWSVFPVIPQVPPSYNEASETLKQVDPVFVDGQWVQRWDVVQASTEEAAQRLTAKSSEVRLERNNRLAACDWTQLPGAPVDASQWSVYRQALRDLTDQPGFPWSVQWPISPASSHPPAAESIGQEWTAPDGTLWRVVQARGDDGQFLPDDPATPDRESLEWVPVP